jgi:hypothetical protein
MCLKDIKLRTKLHLPQLRSIFRAKKSERGEKLQNLDPCALKYICQCALAVLKKFIHLPVHAYKKLSKYKDDLLYLVKKKPSLRQKRARLVEKRGGFLPFILPALASGIATLGSKLLENILSKK